MRCLVKFTKLLVSGSHGVGWMDEAGRVVGGIPNIKIRRLYDGKS